MELDAVGVLHLIEQDARPCCEIIESAISSCWRQPQRNEPKNVACQAATPAAARWGCAKSEFGAHAYIEGAVVTSVYGVALS